MGVTVHTMFTHLGHCKKMNDFKTLTHGGNPYLGTTDDHGGYHWSRCHNPMATFAHFLREGLLRMYWIGPQALVFMFNGGSSFAPTTTCLPVCRNHINNEICMHHSFLAPGVSMQYNLKTIDSRTAHKNSCHGEYTRGNLVSITISHLVLCMQ